MNMKPLLSAIALATAFAGSAGAADIVSGGDLRSVDKWYGRAGGLAGSDRVGALSTGDAKVGVVFDQDVAARTNMPREGTTVRSSTATAPGPVHN